MLILQNPHGSNMHTVLDSEVHSSGAAVHVDIEILTLLFHYSKDSMCLILIDNREWVFY